MTKSEQKYIVQVVLYILNKTKGIDYYHLFKILYFAEQKCLVKWGKHIIPDTFYALEYGPVPTVLYAAIKDLNGSNIIDGLKDNIKVAGDDAHNILLPKKDINSDCIPKSSRDILDDSIRDNQFKSFNQLKNKSHDSAWESAYHSTDKKIDSVLVAKAGGAGYNALKYLKNKKTIETNSDVFSLTPVSDEELQNRRIPVYQYIL